MENRKALFACRAGYLGSLMRGTRLYEGKWLPYRKYVQLRNENVQPRPNACPTWPTLQGERHTVFVSAEP